MSPTDQDAGEDLRYPRMQRRLHRLHQRVSETMPNSPAGGRKKIKGQVVSYSAFQPLRNHHPNVDGNTTFATPKVSWSPSPRTPPPTAWRNVYNANNSTTASAYPKLLPTAATAARLPSKHSSPSCDSHRANQLTDRWLSQVGRVERCRVIVPRRRFRWCSGEDGVRCVVNDHHRAAFHRVPRDRTAPTHRLRRVSSNGTFTESSGQFRHCSAGHH
jgi:hypothetical protein